MADGPWAKYAQQAPAQDGPWAKYGQTPADDAAQPDAQGTLSAAQPESWGAQLGEDLREGGNRTFIGRALGHMQGNGDKGYTGLESGTSKGAADYVGGPELGIAKMIEGGQEVPQKPLQGALKIGSGALQAATLPATFMGGPEAKAAIDAIPSRKAAGQLFQEIMHEAGDQPVNLNQASEPLLRVRELADRGASMPQAAGKLLNRVTKPDTPPLTYREARDFASNLSRLSANDAMKLSPVMRSQVGQLSRAFNGDIGEAAGSVGRGGDYANALKEYSRASKMRDAGGTALKYGAAGLGTGIGGKIARDLIFKK